MEEKKFIIFNGHDYILLHHRDTLLISILWNHEKNKLMRISKIANIFKSVNIFTNFQTFSKIKNIFWIMNALYDFQTF